MNEWTRHLSLTFGRHECWAPWFCWSVKGTQMNRTPLCGFQWDKLFCKVFANNWQVDGGAPLTGEWQWATKEATNEHGVTFKCSGLYWQGVFAIRYMLCALRHRLQSIGYNSRCISSQILFLFSLSLSLSIFLSVSKSCYFFLLCLCVCTYQRFLMFHSIVKEAFQITRLLHGKHGTNNNQQEWIRLHSKLVFRVYGVIRLLIETSMLMESWTTVFDFILMSQALATIITTRR